MTVKTLSQSALKKVGDIAHHSSGDPDIKHLSQAIIEIVGYVNSMQAEISQLKKDLKRANRGG